VDAETHDFPPRRTGSRFIPHQHLRRPRQRQGSRYPAEYRLHRSFSSATDILRSLVPSDDTVYSDVNLGARLEKSVSCVGGVARASPRLNALLASKDVPSRGGKVRTRGDTLPLRRLRVIRVFYRSLLSARPKARYPARCGCRNALVG